MKPMDRAQLVIASNRGPVSFGRDDDGRLVPRRGAGGLVSSLGPLVAGSGATWIAAPMSDADREAAASGRIDVEGFRFHCVDVDPAVYRMAYDVVSNSTLWFLHHHLFDLPRRPRIDRTWRQAWEGYRAYNQAFSRTLADDSPDGAVVLVQDYHLSLVPAQLAELRPDVRVVHFLHTPFCDPTWLRVLPAGAVDELIGGLAGATAVGFHSRRWEDAFLGCCREVLGRQPSTFVSPLAPDPDDLASVAASDACAEEAARLDEAVGDRAVIVRVDRIEPSKNVLRGFQAFDELLRARADLRGRVCFVACVYPSREGLADYVAYHLEVETLARHLNDRWAEPGWTPVILHTTDNFPRSVAALRRYDVLLVNPVRDGLNLVAKEGPVLNTRHGVVALSREAGAWDELRRAAIGLNPFDVTDTAEALAAALDMDAGERSRRSRLLAELASARSPTHWLSDQLVAAGVAA
ncbi:MAG TPA: trehalose-6-phosphate synthase [Acidimicrobiales bacterium]|nr:trehalose-6-phosphate synthase [Acidimicrobiales bacterium]